MALLSMNGLGARGATLSGSDGQAVSVRRADIVKLIDHGADGFEFAPYFRGQSVGLTGPGEAIDAFTRLPDGSLLISTVGAFSVRTDYRRSSRGAGAELVGGGSDLLRFRPVSRRGATAGSWSLYLRGADIGLETAAENVDGLAAVSSNEVLLSTRGAFNTRGLTGGGADVLRVRRARTGPLRVDLFVAGSKIGLGGRGENIDGLFWTAAPNAQLLITTAGNFAVAADTGANADVLALTPRRLGRHTAGTLAPFQPLSAAAAALRRAGVNLGGMVLEPSPHLELQVTVNEQATVALLPAGQQVRYSWAVANRGTGRATQVVVNADPGTPAEPGDDVRPGLTSGDANGNGALDPGETWIYTAARPAAAGPQAFATTVSAVGPSDERVAARVNGQFFGAAPAIGLVKLTNGTDNNSPPGRMLPDRSSAVFSYTVTNPGNVPLAVTLSDDNGTQSTADDFSPTFVSGDVNSDGLLDPGEIWRYTHSFTVASVGQRTSASAVGRDPTGAIVRASDPEFYFGFI